MFANTALFEKETDDSFIIEKIGEEQTNKDGLLQVWMTLNMIMVVIVLILNMIIITMLDSS